MSIIYQVKKKKKAGQHLDHLVCARCSAQHFAHKRSHVILIGTLEGSVVLNLICRGRNWGLEERGNSLKVSWPVICRAEI